MYDVEVVLYGRRKELQGKLKLQVIRENKMVFCLYTVTFALTNYANLGWRDWFSGHISLGVLILLYLYITRWVTKD